MLTLIETPVFELRVDEDSCKMDILIDRSFESLDENIFTFNTDEDSICHMDYKGAPVIAVYKHYNQLSGHELHMWKLVDNELVFLCKYDTDMVTKGVKLKGLNNFKDELIFMIGNYQIDLKRFLPNDIDEKPIFDIEKRITSIF